jgi:hypothetical protein
MNHRRLRICVATRVMVWHHCGDALACISTYGFSTLLVACAPARQFDTVATNDRIPDSVADMEITSCKAQARPSFTPVDHVALCSCVTRGMQRTMSMQEVLALHEAYEAAGPDDAAKTHVFLSNDKIRRVIATWISNFDASQSTRTFTPLVDCELRDGTTFMTTESACDKENNFHYRERILKDREDQLRTGRMAPMFPCNRLNRPSMITTQAICGAMGGTSVLPNLEPKTPL